MAFQKPRSRIIGISWEPLSDFAKRTGLLILVGLVIVAILIGPSCAEKPPTPAAEPVVFRYQSRAPEAHFMSQAVMQFCQALEQKSNGSYKVEQYFAGQLYKDPDIPRVLSSGVLDMSDVLALSFAKTVPEGLVVSGLCGLGKDMTQFHRAIDGELGEIIDKAFQEKANIKIIGWMELGGTDAVSCTKKQIKTLEDWEGLLIRAPGPMNLLFVEDVGAAPVDISSSEVYTALQYGTIDGAITALDSVVSRNIHEVAPYVTHAFIAHTMNCCLGMNLDKWNELPPDDQKMLLDCAKAATEYSRTNCLSIKEETIDFLKAQPEVQFYIVPEEEFVSWQEAVVDNQIKLFEGLAGEETAAELLAILDSYK